MSESQPPAPAQSAQPPVSNAQAETDRRLAEAQAASRNVGTGEMQAQQRATAEAQAAEAAKMHAAWDAEHAKTQAPAVDVPAADMHATDAERSAAADHPGFGQPELPPHAFAPLADGTGHGPVYNPPVEPTAFHEKAHADAMENEKLRQQAVAKETGVPLEGEPPDYGDKLLAEAKVARQKEAYAAAARGETWNEADHPLPTKDELVARDRQQRISVNRTRMPFWIANPHQVRAAPIIGLGDDHVVVSHETRGPDQTLHADTLTVAVDAGVLDEHKATQEPRELTEEEQKLPKEEQDRLLAGEAVSGDWLVQLPDGTQWIAPDHIFTQMYGKF